MFKIICPKCGTENEPGAELCQACQASLMPLPDQDADPSDANTQDEFPFQAPQDQDLPDLLKSLKQEEGPASNEQPFANQERGSQKDEEALESEDSPEEELPAWLRRIRERAREESDAAGEITQKLSAAHENIVTGKSDAQHEDFSAWIQSLRGGSEESPEKPPPEEMPPPEAPRVSEEGQPGWLDRVRRLKGPTFEAGDSEQNDPSQKKGDSLLQWLVALEEGRESVQPVGQEPEPQAQPAELEAPGEVPGDNEPAGEATQKIPVPEPRRGKMPEVNASREEQLQANLFSSMVMDESAARPLREPQRTTRTWAVRLIVGLLVFGLLSAALFMGLPGDDPQPQSMTALEKIPEQPTLLIVAEYQAGFSEEIQLVASPILAEALSPDSEIILVSTEPSGLLLIRDLLGGLPQIEDLSIASLGYFPAPALAAYATAGLSDTGSSWPSSLSTRSTALDGVFILADSYDGARFWVEQFSARQPAVPLYLLVTAQAGPMLAPYLESGQAAGMIAGLSEIAVLDAADPGGGLTLHLRSAYQVGTLLLAVVIATGAILTGRLGKNRKEGEAP